MNAWVWWLIGAGGLLLAEMLTLDLTLALIGSSALAGAAAAGLGAPVAVQVILFAIVAALMLLVVRPIVKRNMRQPRELRTGAAALVGETGRALESVGRDGGRIRLRGETWSARAWDENETIPEGALVEVVRIDGATAVVRGDLPGPDR